MQKKAVELSLNTVVIAAIALIVLLVLIVIFTGYGGKFVRGLGDCGAKGGDDCEDSAAECIDKGGSPAGDCKFYNDDGSVRRNDPDEVCCVYKK